MEAPETLKQKIEDTTFGFGVSSETSEREDKEENEDSFFVLSNAAGVFDGMGGHSAGGVASKMARDYVEAELKKLSQDVTPAQAKDALTAVLTEAHKRIAKKSQDSPLDHWGMGSTADVVFISGKEKGKRELIIGHVGDSRVYVLRRDGSLEQITIDDNNANKIPNLNSVTSEYDLAPEYWEMWERRNVIKNALGAKYVGTRLFSVTIYEGDKVLLCSDGVSDNLTDAEIAELLKKDDDSLKLANSLTKASLDRSREDGFRSKKDDMTAIVIKFSVK